MFGCLRLPFKKSDSKEATGTLVKQRVLLVIMLDCRWLICFQKNGNLNSSQKQHMLQYTKAVKKGCHWHLRDGGLAPYHRLHLRNLLSGFGLRLCCLLLAMSRREQLE